ncbi:MAG TPA: hypothetical protein VII74_03965 [Chthoniobacterales bacterium]
MAEVDRNPNWIEPPPARGGGLGCFAKGCLITVAILCVIFGALVVTGFFGARYVASTYLAKEPAPIPIAPATPEEVHTLKQQWTDFQETARHNEEVPAPERTPAHLEYNASQINQLISASKARGHVSVGISNGVMQVNFSLPTDIMRKSHISVPGFADRYLNGTFTVQTFGPTAPSQVVISNSRLNGRPVPASLFDTSYRGESLRSYVSSYASENALSTFQIVGNNVVFDSPGPP